MPAPQVVVKVSSEDYTKLEKVLSSRLPSSGMIYNVLKLGQSLTAKGRISVRIFADGTSEKWSPDTSTFMGVANVKGLPQNLVVICGPQNGSSKDTILQLLSVLDWTRENQFEGIDNFIAPIVIDEAKRLGELEENDPIGLYYMHKEDALHIFNDKDNKVLSTSSMQVSSLLPSDAAMVEDRWPEKRKGYLEMLEASIESCSSGGVYLTKDELINAKVNDKSEPDLVSFAVALPFGSIHAFHTETDHRRKGYGKLAMKILAQNIAKAGRVPLVQIFKTNDGSKALNEGIGFKYSHDINLLHFTPK
ncbi:hypothetical protein Ocin01_09883 [Orchesella cincta]|uniref:GCN5-related N-acetyltransferase Rv2170-like domain-containing protein n=1 Tax=Orchesella cincta TaxID=48709 RepID=A0A1D2MV47_ORCCI|nr:hypothetical protein Ocin01_09883 [Orchesella cincta]